MKSGQILSAVDTAKATHLAAGSAKDQKAKARIGLYRALCQKAAGNMGVVITFNGKTIDLFPDPYFIIFYSDETQRKEDRGTRYQLPAMELISPNGTLSEFFDALLEAKDGMVSVSVWNAQPR